MASLKKKKKAKNGNFSGWKAKNWKMVGYFFVPGDRYDGNKQAFKTEKIAYR